MIDKRFFESFLRLNNISEHASAAEITTLLTQARWSKKEIKEALRAHTDDGSAELSAQKQRGRVFRPDMEWSSSKLSSLLGVDVVTDPKSSHLSAEKKERTTSTGRKVLIGFIVAIIATAIAAGIGLSLMYFFKVGPYFIHTKEII